MWHYLLHGAPHLFGRNGSVNILKNIIEGCSLSQRQSGQICCPSASEADGCAVGRPSKYDHPPEGIWLTFSLPQTLVWDCVASQQASQRTWLLLLQQQRSRASPAERLWSQQAAAGVAVFPFFSEELRLTSAWITIVCAFRKCAHTRKPANVRSWLQTFMLKLTLILRRPSQPSHCLHGLWLICSGWLGSIGLGSAATGT